MFFKIIFMVVSSLAVALTVDGQAFAASISKQLDLKTYFSANGLTNKDVMQAVTVVSPGGDIWSTGIEGSLKSENFYLTPLTRSHAPIGYSLLVKYDANKPIPLEADACKLDVCDRVEVKKSLKGYEVAVEDEVWSIRMSGSPCLTGSSCQFKVLSWGLEQRRQSGAMRSLPPLITLLQTKEGLCLFDLNSNKLWQMIEGNNKISALGLMKSAFFSEDSLIVAFESGVLYINFLADRVWLANAEGLNLSDSGVGNLTNMRFANSIRSPALNRRLLTHTAGEVIWDDGMIVGLAGKAAHPLNFATHDFPLDEAVAYTDDEKIRIRALTRTATTATLWAYDRFKQKFVPEASFDGSWKQLYLVRDKMLSLSQTEAAIWAVGKKFDLTFNMKAEKITPMADGDLFVRDGNSSVCYWRHLVPNAKSLGSFSESGLMTKCGLTTSFSSSAGLVIMTALAGDRVYVEMLLPSTSSQ